MVCGRGIHNGGFRLYPWVWLLCHAWYRGKTDMRIAAYAFHRPSVRESIDVQDTLIFSKPDWGLDWCPIPFETLQFQISLSRKGREVGARHSKTFMVDVGNFLRS
jgi:hypothetical protein